MVEAKQPTVFDSDQQQLGDVYARALLAFAADAGNVDQLVDELGEVVEAINGVAGLRDALESPRVGVESKVDLLDKAFAGKVEKGLLHFLKVVGNKGRFDCLGAIASSAKTLRDEMSGRVQAVVTSASPMDSEVVGRITDQLSKTLGKDVSLQVLVDPEILGGIVVRVGDTVYDGSVVNQLSQVRARAVKRASDAIREKLDRFTTSE
ncbi:MAG: ATP synthase F1 subunit delta [Planctomycetaceae bacterium]|jgi:F-type H+-transporting ATPase subunit delta|nr:ATP synthase F1 subunit delta [Planctomycetaceae bacterium]MCP4477711.1 ATP synthase F1 subunit delta [Planctomycetaceae bacterium]MCP4774934.1 ATP synthase F1 subunit delta [Planctomycetaceae bacterium]